MIKPKALSSPSLRQSAAPVSTLNPKQQLSAGPVQGGSQAQGAAAQGFSKVDSFEPAIINRHQPRASELQSSLQGLQPSLQELQPLLQGFQPSVQELQPSLQGFQPSVQELQPSLQGFQPSVQELQPSLQGGQPSVQELQPSAQEPQATGSGVPSANDKRPAGDTRSAAQIVDDTPVLKNLGRQKDIKFEQLCKQTGVDPKLDLKDPKQNADGVYRLAKVLEFIDSAKASTGGDRSNKVQGGVGDGNIEGITKDGDARHGTEAGMLKDFAEKGYSFLGEHQLPTTNDTHVKADGSNKDNFQWFAGEAGKALWFMPVVSNVLTGVGNSEGGFKGVLEGAATGYVNTLKGAAEGVIGSITKGRANPAGMIFGGVMGALGNTEAAPQPVKDIANLLG